jgi:pimeloyl-ACP methyl ester carboxylesterase
MKSFRTSAMKISVRRWVTVAVGLLQFAIAPAEAEQKPPLSPQAAWYTAYQRDSRLVTLPDGRKLNLYCVGTGSPTVMLESGIGGDAYDWRAVQDKIAAQTRVCSYDRAGLGKSSLGPLPRDVKAEVADFEALLKAADLRGPYVLVGHSVGGYLVRLFAFRHLDDVAALVLVDPSVDDQLPLMEAALPMLADGIKKSVDNAQYCSNPNPSDEVLKNCTKDAPESFPPDLKAAWMAAHGVAFTQTWASEMVSFPTMDSPEVVAEKRSLGSMPLIILTRGERSTNMTNEQAETEWTVWNKLHEDLAKLSSAGVNRVVPGANHYIQLDQPDAVVQAVDEAVTAARKQH